MIFNESKPKTKWRMTDNEQQVVMNEPSIHQVTNHDEVANQQPVVNGAVGEDSSASAQLRELQKLLFDTDQKQEIAQLKAEWNDPEHLAPRVSQILPDAISQRATEDYQLTEAMMPFVVESIKVSAKRNPEHISDAIFPILGPAIRKAVAQAIANLTQTINQTLQHSFSSRGLKWRWEAFATGKSFAEVVLYHSLVYRVEQVLLIHRPTGLVLSHVLGDAVKAQEPELISGMLTAIRDFIQDSYGASEEADAEFNYDDLRVLTVAGPRASLACAVRGVPPTELKEEMQETIERIHQERGDKLKSFDGDTTPFEMCHPLLEELLKTRYQAFADPTRQGMPKVAWAILSVALLAFSVWGFFYVRDWVRWNSYLDKLRASPGIVLTDTERGWRRYSLTGLRDPLAVDAATLMPDFALNPAKLEAHWKEYQAPELAEARAKKLLNPPPGVTLKLKDGMLYATGLASQQWISDAKKLAPFIPGITQLEWEAAGELAVLQQEIEAQSVRCIGNKIAPGQDSIVVALIRKVKRLDELAQQSNKIVSIRAIGHTDSTGTKEINQILSQERAQEVKSLLEARSGQLTRTKFITEGVGDQHPIADLPEANRRVTFKVEVGS